MVLITDVTVGYGGIFEKDDECQREGVGGGNKICSGFVTIVVVKGIWVIPNEIDVV